MLRFKSFPGHTVPKKGTNDYFHGTVDRDQKQVLICVTCYNETAAELERTLLSLYEQRVAMPDIDVKIVLIQDGWDKADPSFQDYVYGLYGKQAKQQILEAAEGPATTVVVELLSNEELKPQLQEIMFASGKSLCISTLLKTYNGRKHNSHEWFLRGAAPAYSSSAVFLTDCGTQLVGPCLVRAMNFLMDSPGMCAVCGLPRPTCFEPNTSPMQMFHTMAQQYESSACAYGVTAAIAAIGFVTCLPGPFQLVRTEDAMNEEFQDMYFNWIGKDPSELGMLQANMQLAEDRAFTFFLAATSKRSFGFLPDSLMYYDVESKTSRFLGQRRRWMNGGIASLLDAMAPSNYSRYWGKLGVGRVVLVQGMMYFYLLGQLASILGPAIISSITYSAIVGLGEKGTMARLPYFAEQPDAVTQTLAVGTVGFFWLALGIFMVLHHYTRTVHRWAYMMSMAINTVCAGIMMIYFYKLLSNTVLLTLGVLIYITPIVNAALLGDWEGVYHSSVFMVVYYAYSPNYMLLMSYALSQCYNLTWGSRPFDAATPEGAQRLARMQELKSQCKKVMAAYFFTNLAVSIALASSTTFATAVVPSYTVILLLGVAAAWMPLSLGYCLYYKFRTRNALRPAVKKGASTEVGTLPVAKAVVIPTAEAVRPLPLAASAAGSGPMDLVTLLHMRFSPQPQHSSSSSTPQRSSPAAAAALHHDVEAVQLVSPGQVPFS